MRVDGRALLVSVGVSSPFALLCILASAVFRLACYFSTRAIVSPRVIRQQRWPRPCLLSWCAATSDVYTWGSGCWGQLGVGSEANSPTPLLVSFLLGKGINKICCGAEHVVAIAGGSLFAHPAL